MKKTLLAAAAAAALAPLAAHATDGYFQHGYGMKAKGRGGASTAMLCGKEPVEGRGISEAV